MHAQRTADKAQLVVLHRLAQQIFHGRNREHIAFFGVLIHFHFVPGDVPVICAHRKAVVLLAPFTGVERMLRLNVEIPGRRVQIPWRIVPDIAAVVQNCGLGAVFLILACFAG